MRPSVLTRGGGGGEGGGAEVEEQHVQRLSGGDRMRIRPCRALQMVLGNLALILRTIGGRWKALKQG